MSREPEPAPPPFDADRLVAEGRALRALARSLLGAAAADDVVHDAYVAALQRRDGVRRAGPWLTGVVTRLAARWRRSDARRTARERRVARDGTDAASDPAQIAAEAETLRAIATAVHELDEPFRTVIVLRFWHDASTHDIASRLGVPHDTVRSRLFRGFERLRATLDARRGGRDAWRGAVLAIVSPREATAAPALSLVAFAGILMNFKLVAGGVIAAALVLVIAQAWPRGDSAARGHEDRPVAAAPVAAAPGPTETERSPARELVAATATTPPVATGATDIDDQVAPWRLQVVVQDADKNPVPDATVRVWPCRRAKDRTGYTGRQDVELATVRTDALGRAATTVDREGVMVRAERERSISTEHFAFQERADVATVLTLREVLSVRGRVVRQDGSSAPGATVTATGEMADTATVGFTPSAKPVLTGDDGTFELLLAPRCRYTLQGAADNATTFRVDLTTRDLPIADVVLAFPGAVTVRGVVVDADGKTMADASVRIWRDVGGDPKVDGTEQRWLRTDGDGGFACDLRETARYGLLASAEGQPPSDVLWIEPTAERPHADVRVALQRFATIEGVVQTTRGEALKDARVHASAGPLDAAARLEPERCERFTTAGAVSTDASGRFELRVHPGTSWTVVVTPDASVPSHTLRREGIVPGTRGLAIIASDDELHGCPITGTATTTDGAPWADFEPKVEFVDENVLVRLGWQRRATFDGASFVLPVEGVGRSIAIVLTPPPASPFAPLRLGPFRTTRAGIHLQVTPQQWAVVPVRLQAQGGKLRPGLRVSLTPDEPGANWDTTSRPVDDDGRATLQRRMPGANTLHVVGDAGVIHTQPATLLPGPNPELVVTVPAAANKR